MILKRLGRVSYEPTLAAMREFTAARTSDTPDELWLCEHPPVYTQGIAGKPEHVLAPGSVPVVQTDRGGQVTYHGPGQVVAYPLVDLSRLGIYVKEYVFRLEHAVLRTLQDVGITGHRVPGAPGIYLRVDAPASHEALTGPVNEADPFAGLGKIAALGIKVHRHRTYHGLSLNVAMDLRPFSGVNPCGYAGLATVDLATLGVQVGFEDAATLVAAHLQAGLRP